MNGKLNSPLPDKVVVSSAALAQIINALNGPQYMILELLHTRGLSALGVANPIDTIEDELLKYQSGETPAGVVVSNISVNVDEKMIQDAMEGVLKNYARIGGDTEPEKLLGLMVANNLVVMRSTDIDGKVYYGLDKYNAKTGFTIAVTEDYDTPRDALRAFFVKESTQEKTNV